MADPFQPKFVDLVRNVTTTSGTGNFVLGVAVNGYTSFASALQPGDSFYYSALGVDKPAEREVGRGTLQANGTVSRDPISGTKTNFGSGTKTLSLIAAAEWFTNVQAGGGDGGASATAAAASATAAATSATAAGASATAAAGSAAAAEDAEAGAEAARDAAIAAGSGGGGQPPAPTRAALAALGNRQMPVLLAESGREGLFAFDGASHAANVAADPYQGLYVAPGSDPTGASGAWVRRFTGAIELSWFGLADGAANNAARVESAMALIDSSRGKWLVFPLGQIAMDRRVVVSKPCRIEGHGGGTGTSGASLGSGNTLLVFPAGSTGFRVAHAIGGQQAEISNMRIAQASLLGTTGVASYNPASPNVISVTSGAANFANDQVVLLEGAGPSVTILGRTAAITSGTNVATISTSGGDFLGNPGVYVGQHVEIAGANLPAGTVVTAWTTSTVTLSNAAGATVSGASYTVKAPLVAEVQSGGGTGTLTIDSSSFNCQAVTGAVLRHAAPALMTSTQMRMRNVEMVGCDVGVFLHGNTTGGAVADNCSFHDCLFGGDFAGVVLEGYDAQVNSFYSCNFAGPRVGVLDLSYLGNDFVGCHWAFNVGIFCGSTGCQSKILGGYFETGTSYIAPWGSMATFYGTVSMFNGSGFRGLGPRTGANNFLDAPSLYLHGALQCKEEPTLGANACAILDGGIHSYGSHRVVIQNSGNFSYAANAGTAVQLFVDSSTRGYVMAYDASGPGFQPLYLVGNEVRVRPSDADVVTINATGLNMASGKVVQINGTTVVDASRNVFAAGIAASADVTTSGGKLGYASGAGGAVTQLTSKSTGVTLNKAGGQITTHNAALAAGAIVEFTVTNSLVAATDTINLNLASGAATTSAYRYRVSQVGTGSFKIAVENRSAGALSEALVFNFALLKAVNA